MSGEEEDSADKEHEASQRKLDQAREKGEIPRSIDLLTAAAYAGMLIAGLSVGAGALQKAGHAGMVMLDQADRLGPLVLASGRGPAVGLVSGMILPLWSFVLFPAAAVMATLFVTKGWLFTPDKLNFRINRISPIATAAQKFGRSGLFEFAKSCVKLCIVAVILGLFLQSRAGDILATQRLEPGIVSAILLRLIVEFLSLILCLSMIMGGTDFLWQRAEHGRRNRMSRKEVMDEARESDGDPHQKAARRQRAMEIATNRMLTDVAKADVIIVNPTHYAVALKWTRGDRSAPVCLAKGVDEIAARIRERAAEHRIPVHSDPPTARALHATVEVGQQIRAEHYRAVAAAIRFAEAMRQRARRLP